jgi:hypothetical protein
LSSSWPRPGVSPNTGVILRAGGDQHALRTVVQLHRRLLALGAAEWLGALTGLQAHHDLAAAMAPPLPPPSPLRTEQEVSSTSALDHGPAEPPPVLANRGQRPKPPPWLTRFVTWGPLSGVPFGPRLGREVLRAPDLRPVVQHLIRWPCTPLWHPAQIRYRRHAWWTNMS